MDRYLTQLASNNMSLGAPVQGPNGFEGEGETPISQRPPVPDGGLLGGGADRETTGGLADNSNGYTAPKGKERATGECHSGIQSC
jgi:hypothetical protein